MSAPATRVSRKWLSLREPVDAAARASSPSSWVDESRVPAAGVIHDLGCGTGAIGRWLAPLLLGQQHWVLHDRDAAILEVAAADLPGSAADGATVPVETTQSDIIQLDPGDLADASLITASALLDLLTAEELATLLTVCAGAGCPILPSPWRLGAAQAPLAAEWFTGWVGAASEQQTGPWLQGGCLCASMSGAGHGRAARGHRRPRRSARLAIMRRGGLSPLSTVRRGYVRPSAPSSPDSERSTRTDARRSELARSLSPRTGGAAEPGPGYY